MKEFFGIICLFIFLSILSSCEEQTTVDKNIKRDVEDPHYILLENPYDWVGVQHNQLLSTFDSLLYFGRNNGEWNNITFPSIEFDNLVISYSNDSYHLTNIDTNMTFNYLNSLYISSGICVFTNNYWHNWDISNDWENLFDNVLRQYSTQDSLYSSKVLDLLKESVLLSWESDTLLQRLYALEDEMLMLQWEQNDELAFKVLSVAKYSAEFWSSYDWFKWDVFSMNAKNEKKPKILLSAAERKRLYVASTVIADAVGCAAGTAAAPGPGSVAGAIVGSGKAIAVASSIESVGNWLGLW